MPSLGWWADEGVVACGIEDPRGMSAGVIYRVQGAVIACLPTWLLVHPLVPSEWRKLAGLQGNASKPEVAVSSVARLYEHHDLDGGTPVDFEYHDWPQDAHDAHLIAVATLSLIRTEAAA
jgi:hypothetical protein